MYSPLSDAIMQAAVPLFSQSTSHALLVPETNHGICSLSHIDPLVPALLYRIGPRLSKFEKVSALCPMYRYLRRGLCTLLQCMYVVKILKEGT